MKVEDRISIQNIKSGKFRNHLRKPGYYWVKFTDLSKYEPAFYNGIKWFFIASTEGFDSDKLYDIQIPCQ